ncbi:hypothetical protein NPIL_138991 [Nephila pilipes]|uniref:Uncharacterized protein n=1 Tax=Nephila pilipes TaxID=299642 RepID=A0A8X6TQJ2_NEPPI|nr:hypothetical protein NPIL_138991 [Nephila pilipes]
MIELKEKEGPQSEKVKNMNGTHLDLGELILSFARKWFNVYVFLSMDGVWEVELPRLRTVASIEKAICAKTIYWKGPKRQKGGTRSDLRRPSFPLFHDVQ